MEFDDHRLSVGWAQHEKILDLMDALGAAGAIGWLNLLGYAAAWAPDGCLGPWPEPGKSGTRVARKAGLQLLPDPPSPSLFCEKLVELGLVDVDGDGLGWLHDWSDHQPGIFKTYRRRVNGRKGGRPPKKPRRETGPETKGPQQNRTQSVFTGECETGQETKAADLGNPVPYRTVPYRTDKTPLPPTGGKAITKPLLTVVDPEAVEVAKSWNAFTEVHGGKAVKLPLGKTVRELIEKALRNAEFREYWREALELLVERPNPWVIKDGGQKLDWFLRVGRSVNAAKIVETGYALGEPVKSLARQLHDDAELFREMAGEASDG